MTTLTLLPSDLDDIAMPDRRALQRLGLSEVEFKQACAKWRFGAPVFGHWAAKHVEPWSARTFGELIALIRIALDDATDYSQVTE